MKRFSFNALSIACAGMGALALFLVVRELPHNDGVYGDYINLILQFAKPVPAATPEFHVTPAFTLTEARCITALYLCSAAFFVAAVCTGVLAHRRGETSIGHAGPVTLSLILLGLMVNLRWIATW